mgnify:FL=1|tara:strand:+ start:213 stop:1403 length:1191 start_codon:yes stop_codon:yes gene_type:complete
MANFEYYLDLYSNNKRMLYRSSYEAAYRDLMAEYNEEVRVQNLLAKMAVSDKKANAAMRKALTNGGPSYSEVTSFNSMNTTRRNNEAVAQAKAEKAVDSGYEYPTTLNELIWKLATDHAGDEANFEGAWNRQMAINVSGLTKKQQKQLAVDMEPIINRKVYGGAGQAVIMTEYFYQSPTYSSVQLDQEKEQERQVARAEAAMPPSALERKQYAQALASFPELEGYDIEGGSSTVGQKKSIFEAAKIKPPSEQDILARAAEYHEPKGSKKFKKGMEEIAVERETQAAADKQAKQDLVASMPAWGGQALKYAPEVESLAEEDDKALADRADTGITLGLQTFNSQQFPDIGDALDHINSQDTDDTQKQMALKTYLSRQYRRWREDQDNSVEAVIGLNDG